ncbi:sigma-w pathway protein ysdB [Oceanobacillus sp. 1P07AA]|uniref:sigma-w pathway protein ysdB n=1 Tax=Oceanobacillus sp. 1P07AA TaxID=3132293 RepID=UPI0039A58B03
MLVISFRILLIIAIGLLIYTLVQYLRKPERKLKLAQNNKQFYLLDEEQNDKKNFQLTYMGCLFEGEKYLGATENKFEVVDIHVTVKDPHQLQGLSREDLFFIEDEIIFHYPYAVITWKHPINKILQSSK